MGIMVCLASAMADGQSPNARQDLGITAEREAQIQQRVEEMVSTMTLEQKIAQLMGTAGEPKLERGEAISGINVDGATTLPQQIGISCTWNPELLRINTTYTSKLMRDLGISYNFV